jgi:uncharacterized protein (UPF0262 family)
MSDITAVEQQRQRLAGIRLDEGCIVRWAPEIEQERSAAIYALLEQNSFIVKASPEAGPYHLHLSIIDNNLLMRLSDHGGHHLDEVSLSLSPFRNLVKEYFAICEAYFSAVKGEGLSRIETLDMGRRGLHNEGAGLLSERLESRISMDLETARRLFTLLCVLHLRERAYLQDSA